MLTEKELVVGIPNVLLDSLMNIGLQSILMISGLVRILTFEAS